MPGRVFIKSSMKLYPLDSNQEHEEIEQIPVLRKEKEKTLDKFNCSMG